MEKSFTLISACRDFFGLLPGQTMLDFGKEYRKLSEQDKREFRAELTAIGYAIVDSPLGAKQAVAA